MKKVLTSLCLPICLGIILFTASCDTENFDDVDQEVVGTEEDEDNGGDDDPASCNGDITGLASWYPEEFGSELEEYLQTLSSGDQCWNIYNVETTIDENCNCPADQVPDDFCEELEGANENYPNGYIGAECWTADNEQGTISADCLCVADENNGGGNTGECETVGNLADWYDVEFPNGYDLSPGDSCWTSDDEQGTVNEDCECTNEGELDCPGLNGNIGDSCQEGWGIITVDCDCVENEVGACQGDVSGIDMELALSEFGTQESLDEWIMTLSPGDWCVTSNNWQATVSEDCNCE